MPTKPVISIIWRMWQSWRHFLVCIRARFMTQLKFQVFRSSLQIEDLSTQPLEMIKCLLTSVKFQLDLLQEMRIMYQTHPYIQYTGKKYTPKMLVKELGHSQEFSEKIHEVVRKQDHRRNIPYFKFLDHKYYIRRTVTEISNAELREWL